MIPARALVSIFVLGLTACPKSETKDTKFREAKVTPSTKPLAGSDVEVVDPRDLPNVMSPEAEAKSKTEKAKDTKKGDQSDNEWVPAEFKSGMARWKDTGVYVDGEPRGFLTWGELPITLKPTWVRDRVSANKRPGTNDLPWRWAQQRFYRFTDYLKAIGIDVKTVKEIHVYGPKFTQTIVATGKDLQTPDAKGFMFRFGGNYYGKAIPQVPLGFGNGKTPDKITAVMIYIAKEPPKLVRDVGLVLDGKEQIGVPYRGEPIRGGVRVYLDDKYAAIIKRQELDPKQATKGDDGELRWKLVDLLTAQGVDLKKVAELWVVRDEQRRERFPASELETMTFEASSQAKGGVLLTDKKVRANAIALHTRLLKDSDLPLITPDDD